MSGERKAILVASRDPQQSDVRRHILEDAGFEVVSAMELRAVEKACNDRIIAGAVIGYSLPPAEKRRVWQTIRDLCGPDLPVLELLEGGKAQLLEAHALYTHDWATGQGFAKAVQDILIGKKPRVEDGKASANRIGDLVAEYNDVTARLRRGTSPNMEMDNKRVRELVREIQSLNAGWREGDSS